MTLVTDLKKEYTRIMRSRKEESPDLARRYASGAYLALEFGSPNKVEVAVSTSSEAYRDGMLATTVRKEYDLLEGERELVHNLSQAHQNHGMYWGLSGEKQYVGDLHDFLVALRGNIDPAILESIRGQKKYRKILGRSKKSTKKWSLPNIETVFRRLESHKEKTGQLQHLFRSY